MTVYLGFKYIHVMTAIISISGFFLRGVWMIRQSPKLQSKVVKVVPHVNDTLLLTSALIMVFMSAQYPFVVGWLTAKVIALLVYIALGMVALKWGRTPGIKIAAWILGLATFGYIVSVALTRSPTGILVYF